MSTHANHAIVVTAYLGGQDLLARAAVMARSYGLQVLGPSKPVVNGCSSILICPDGSKEGWKQSDLGDLGREELKDWLREEGAGYLEWVEVLYGDDIRLSVVLDDFTKKRKRKKKLILKHFK